MNRQQYKQACCDKVIGIHRWEYKTRKILKSLMYNSDPNAKCIHHLQDTEEQRKYNDEHYEYFGFNQDGTFEYGKYVIFMTEKEHNEYHNRSLFTRQRISDGCKQVWQRDGYREYMSKMHSDYYKNNPDVVQSIKNSLKEYWSDEELRNQQSKTQKELWDEDRRKQASERVSKYYLEHPEVKEQISNSRKGKHAGEEHWLYGKHHSSATITKISKTQKSNMTEEHRQKISNATKEAMKDPAIRQKLIDANTGENNHNYGKPRDNRTRSKISESKKFYMLKLGELFREYKANGGTLKWNQFQTYAKDNNLIK